MRCEEFSWPNRGKGRATSEQKKWREQFIERGYKSVITRGREACLEQIRRYH
jgi:hypothetical protein